MRLPGRLKATSLGDVLGSLFRGRTTGTLELTQDNGRTHRVFVSAGLVIAVELDAESQPLGELLRRDRLVDEEVLKRSVLRSLSSHRLLGEVLVTDFHISPSVVGAALRRQVLTRLYALEQVADARISFRVAVRTPKSALIDAPLEPREFLSGRKRARDRDAHAPAESGHYPLPHARPRMQCAPDPVRLAALAVLELGPDADPADIKRAYRRLARAYHPDLHPGATAAERRDLERHFAALTSAYQALVA